MSPRRLLALVVLALSFVGATSHVHDAYAAGWAKNGSVTYVRDPHTNIRDPLGTFTIKPDGTGDKRVAGWLGGSTFPYTSTAGHFYTRSDNYGLTAHPMIGMGQLCVPGQFGVSPNDGALVYGLRPGPFAYDNVCKGRELFVRMGGVTRQLTVWGGGFDPAWSEDDRIAYTDDAGELVVINADGWDRRVIAAKGGNPSWSPFADQIAYETPQGIAVADDDGSNQRLIIPGGIDPEWSPDGTKIMYATGPYMGGEIFLADTDGSARTRLTEGWAAHWNGASTATGPVDDAHLIAAYSFDGVHDDVVPDTSGRGNDGLLVNGATTPRGKRGAGLSLDGDGDFVRLPPLGTFYDHGFTVEAWVKKASTKADAAVVGAWRASRGGGPMIWADHHTGQYRLTATNQMSQYLPSSHVPVSGSWEHLAATSDGATMTFYVNGQLVAAQDAPDDMGGSVDWKIGAFGATADAQAFFDGVIDDVRIYDRALTASEIRSQVDAATAEDDSLIAAYSFDAVAAGASTVDDDSGTGNSGTIVGAAPVGDGRSGGALSFDGTDDRVDLPSLGTFYKRAFALEAWVKPAAGSRDTAIVGSWTGGGGPMLWSDHLVGRQRLTLGTALGDYLDSGRDLVPNTWQHVAATYDGTTARFYLDGVEVASKPWSGDVGGSDTWRIGAYGTTATGHFRGRIDDIRIYSRALSAAEIAADRGDVVPPIDDGPRLVAAYSFDAVAAGASTVEDDSGAGNSGTIFGAAPVMDGRSGGALSFDGTDDRVDLPSLGAFYKRAFTLEAWVEPASDARDSAIVGSWTGAGGPMLWNDHVVGRQRLTLGTGLNEYLDSGRVLAPGTWQHVAATYDGTIARFYVNGVEVASKPYSGGVGGSDTWRIGAYGASPAGFFHGRIDDVRIYNGALAPDQFAFAQTESPQATADS